MRPTSTDLLPIGTALWSADRRHADAEQNPSHVGGLLVDQWANADGERSYRVVDLHHGRPMYAVLADSEIAWEHVDGLVNLRSVRGMVLAMQAESAACRDPGLHLTSLLALARVAMMAYGPEDQLRDVFRGIEGK